jgi:putative two-component system response regulator
MNSEGLERVHVLVVDDETSIRQLLEEGLDTFGYHCTTAVSGKKALEILSDKAIDVVITDIMMPEMNGIELTRRIKQKYKADVIMMTGFVGNYTYEEVIAAGASDFIQKPFELNEFFIRLKRVLKERAVLADRDRAVAHLRQNILRLHKTLEGVIQAIATSSEMRDPYTAGHQRRTSLLACAIADLLGLSGDRIFGIQMAGVIHDVGKLAVPAEILAKPARLTELEFGLIKTHAQSGYDILKEVDFPWPLAEITLQHHERLDGSGYPQGLSDKDILREAKIMAVADVVEAMSSHRPYRPGLGIDKALEEISKNKGILYDPEIADACISVFKEKNFCFT